MLRCVCLFTQLFIVFFFFLRSEGANHGDDSAYRQRLDKTAAMTMKSIGTPGVYVHVIMLDVLKEN